MREINLSPSRSKDLKSAQTIFNEKKLEMHERRCEYRKSNTKFELYRGRFYRELREDKYGPTTYRTRILNPFGPICGKFPKKKIKTSLSIFWNSYHPMTEKPLFFHLLLSLKK
ncbi:hypothetical protein NGRA_3388 [Nosema granulosis]|uniref:Uncharacterized protein n=1 Tax=Nosema granulosis TaxID=83296 RepID=A0A9P6KX81_9MICR|nr:hypothetical protein NGRA_3388 [Nosema granulosis]